ncbi:hypothetical protein [Catellatospora chokoriensis]|uniref:DUF2269 domain-containing protein n=1 Tax=Catellatospora chokoriensis TaxID=310353 RepID=A0A8J3K0B8_9ACTN|nr:hypothetical protein [Catellatospora chokoriensis]GIF90353.1 hypothetical protein Cch02nite_37970 [Catellatospora chokoriensis]
MPMPPRLRKTALTAHITTSLAWLGAVTSFVALAVVGLTTTDPGRAHAAYTANDIITTAVIVPLAFASLTTGIIQSAGTTWGLLRHYWVLAKTILTVPATGVLLLHTGPIAALADPANVTALAAGQLRGLQIQVLTDAGAAIVVLLVTTALATFKPRGMTGYGYRRTLRQPTPA